MIRITTFAGKDVAVFGLGASGNATVEALVAGGARVSAWDDNASGREAAAQAGVPVVDLTTADWSRFSALVLAPGVPLTHPQPHWTVGKAKAAGIEVIGDIELFCRERSAVCPEAPFIAITGTNGKSTTTALIAHILRQAGKDVQLGGNIGRAVLTLEPMTRDRYYVVECSSFQIDLAPSINPSVGILLNITPDHLDRHGTLAHYAAVKERLIVGAADAVVVVDDVLCAKIAERRASTGGRLARGSAKAKADVYFDTPKIYRAGSAAAAADLTGIGSLRGRHNGENAVAALAALSFAGLADAEIARHFKTYPGLAHRMEEIARIGRVLYVNDSKATNADSTGKALQSFQRDVFWIVGGKSKEGGIEALRPYFEGIVRVYLIGASTEEFSRTLDGDAAIVPCGTLDVAVTRAAADAEAYARGEAMLHYNVQGSIGIGTHIPGSNPHPVTSTAAEPVVLLSPACASFDQYKNFEERGDHFRRLVASLPGIKPMGAPA